MMHKERVLVSRTDDGKPVYKWATGSTLDELHDAVVQIYVDTGLIERFLINGKIPPEKRKTFKEYTENWMKTYKEVSCKGTTLSGYWAMLKSHFYPAFGSRVFCQITVQDLQEFLNARQHLSKKYLGDMVKFFGMISRAAIEDGVVERDITASSKLTIPSDRKNIREALELKDYFDVIDHLPKLKYRDRCFMSLILFTGLRRGEALALRWEDIDTKHGVIHVSQNVTYHGAVAHVGTPKTENGFRDVPVTQHLLSVLGEQKSGYIITASKNADKPVCHSTYAKMWKQIRSAINVHNATPHIFRHTYLTILAGLNVDVKTLQAIAGHSDIQITMNRYVHKRTEGILKAGELFETEILCDRNVKDLELPEVKYDNTLEELKAV